MGDEVDRFSVRTVKHPIFWVHDLDEAAAWFEHVFGQPTQTTADVMADVPKREGFPVDYGIFHLIQDTFVESIDPARLVLGGKSEFPLRGIPPLAVPSLGHFGWYVDGAEELMAKLWRHGWRCLNQAGEVTEEMSFGGKVGYPSFYVLRDEAGLAYQFMECAPSEVNARRTGDARLAPEWELSRPPGGDELGVLFCSHHTVVSNRPERVLGLWVDILGGQVIHRDRNGLIGSESTYVALGDGVFEVAKPLSGGLNVHGELSPEPHDSYHSMTFLVRDLDRAERHLLARGVRIAQRDADSLVTDPTTSFGVPWAFTTSLVPGDSRTGSALISGGKTLAH